ncbi:phosphocholine cytidylyltransferase family protein [Salipiger sp. IMCC34102]|uniref:phosphocholine cytidylyltransferase family protein n=1 Tax=Salipiger sp. IMCC34102 TaxID=2510647 RepID=UPI00101CB1A4|nr:phosphocholine cytidylyltransferase family protein [Salipiger sp. IMCC34102]RYH01060.1 phosphocholine cytidylyltransferase family protein [Salipiger sp. IMCC34102]
MRAIILAAGRGSRMRHLTDDRPKGLTPLRGVPLIERQCTALRAAGVSEIGIVTGYMAERLEPYADTVFHNPRWAETQMVTSLEAGSDWLASGPVIVSYSDIFYPAGPVRALSKATTDVAITFDPGWERQWSGRFEDPLDDAETFRIRTDAQGRSILTEIGRKPQRIDAVQGQYMGLSRFTPQGWAQVQSARASLSPPARDTFSMTALFDLLIARDAQIQAIATTDPWGEIDSVEDLAFFEGSSDLFP